MIYNGYEIEKTFERGRTNKLGIRYRAKDHVFFTRKEAKQFIDATENPKHCPCGCSHIIGWNDRGACYKFDAGANGRCVYCDHAKDCHNLSASGASN